MGTNTCFPCGTSRAGVCPDRAPSLPRTSVVHYIASPHNLERKLGSERRVRAVGMQCLASVPIPTSGVDLDRGIHHSPTSSPKGPPGGSAAQTLVGTNQMNWLPPHPCCRPHTRDASPATPRTPWPTKLRAPGQPRRVVRVFLTLVECARPAMPHWHRKFLMHLIKVLH